MEIKIIQPFDERWTCFVEAHPSATLFHHPIWAQFLARVYHYRPFVLAGFDSAGQVTAGIPFMEINRVIGGKRLAALPFTDHCAPLYADGAQEPLMKALLDLYADTGAKELELRWGMPELPGVQTKSEFVLHTLDLEPDASKVLKRWQPAHRRNLKTAQNSGLRVEQGTGEDALREFYALHLQTRRRQGMPIQPWKFFQLLGKELLEQGHGFVLLAYNKSECIAAAIYLHWRNKLIYKFGASAESGLPYRPNNLVMWTAIQWGCENGCTQFDFGRTDIENEGLRRFKLGFGSQEIPLDYSILTSQPLRKEEGVLLNVMHSVIQHSPAWVCRVAGEAFYRYAG